MTDQEQKKIFSKNLSNLLYQKGKTQIEVSKVLDVSPQVFNTWIKGIALPRMGKIQALADYFNVSTAALIDPPSGAGVSMMLSPVEESIITSYREADEGTRSSIRKLLDVKEDLPKSEAG